MKSQRSARILAIALLLIIAPLWVAEAQSGARGRSRSRTREATLTVQTNVDSAQISINGDRQGGNPPWEFTLTPDTYRITVAADGYRTFQENVTLESGETRTLNANLEAQTFSLNVDPNVDGAQIEIEGAGQGRGSVQVSVRPGTYTVRITAPGYDTYTTRVTVRGDQTLRPELTPSTVTVRVEVPDTMRADNDESFTVFIDGDQFTGSTFQVRPGRRDFRIVSGAWAAEGRFVLRPGEEYTLRPSLTLTLEQ